MSKKLIETLVNTVLRQNDVIQRQDAEVVKYRTDDLYRMVDSMRNENAMLMEQITGYQERIAHQDVTLADLGEENAYLREFMRDHADLIKADYYGKPVEVPEVLHSAPDIVFRQELASWNMPVANDNVRQFDVA